jgi:hypothetical protein
VTLRPSRRECGEDQEQERGKSLHLR